MSLLFNFRPLVVNPELAARIGLNEAIVLQQLKYWITETDSGVDHDDKRWVYNTHEQWVRQFPFWSVDTVKRTLSSLQRQGLVLVEKLAKAKHDQTNFYTINYLADALIDQGNLPSSKGGNLPSSSRGKLPSSSGAEAANVHTEITTESTSEITSSLAPSECSPPVITMPLNTGIEYPITAAQVTEWSELFPAVDVMQQLRAMRAWLLSNPKKRKTKAGIARFVTSWLSRDQDRGGSRSAQQPRQGMSRQEALEARNRQAADDFIYGDNFHG